MWRGDVDNSLFYFCIRSFEIAAAVPVSRTNLASAYYGEIASCVGPNLLTYSYPIKSEFSCFSSFLGPFKIY
jgi:hypothetical protein